MLFANQGKKVEIKYLPNISPIQDNGEDVIEGLSGSPKVLPPKYFYDRTGSLLFEKICELPEYYPTRTETTILTNFASEIASLTGICELVELGSGSSTKTRLLLSAYENMGKPWRYIPIDVSGEMLNRSSLQLAKEYSLLSILGLVGTYEQALWHLPPKELSSRMVVFLGSSLGNFTGLECDRLFTEIAEVLEEGDYFLLGVDLQKPVSILENAYNDSQGVTAEFNLNMLSHLNQRFDGNFRADLWTHKAIYNQELNQIEMYLHCDKKHQVSLKSLDLTVDFSDDDFILTEISRKFDLTEMEDFLQSHHLNTIQFWTDEKQWFGLILAQVRKGMGNSL
ncbi:L-histidine N(alpha)-methyltransferase [Cyanobacterium stanieri LEGE 03274]|uniref:L-histidine N(Alpha)-methyltransferase n=1 Tax=Cyanobacterium stanieri LEGE 03274 TaxID=1828756 RepID=A0ABR9V594_9CHRO|nr:L-histidine N(alpha)-methyltransferase [Cyanobacterium stanieri]MBE9223065.1 L-histidine N(alpha)-methyltransferase [Cyanobacterium stanieri LEGE 03274]